jgi:hypothetical protein
MGRNVNTRVRSDKFTTFFRFGCSLLAIHTEMSVKGRLISRTLFDTVRRVTVALF